MANGLLKLIRNTRRFGNPLLERQGIIIKDYDYNPPIYSFNPFYKKINIKELKEKIAP